jgi:hypothetical protein
VTTLSDDDEAAARLLEERDRGTIAGRDDAAAPAEGSVDLPARRLASTRRGAV